MTVKRGKPCPAYDGFPEYGGPCWTCQGLEGRCPIGDLAERLLWDSATPEEASKEIRRLRKAVGEQTAMVKRWKNRASHERRKRKKATSRLVSS